MTIDIDYGSSPSIQANQTFHITDLPQQLQREAVSQIVYNTIKQDAALSQGNSPMLAQAYTVIHSIDFNRYMQGLIDKNRNVISLMVIEISNALETLGIIVDKDTLALQFI